MGKSVKLPDYDSQPTGLVQNRRRRFLEVERTSGRGTLSLFLNQQSQSFGLFDKTVEILQLLFPRQLGQEPVLAEKRHPGPDQLLTFH